MSCEFGYHICGDSLQVPDKVPIVAAKAKNQLGAFEEFARAISQAEPLGEDFARIISEGIRFPKEATV